MALRLLVEVAARVHYENQNDGKRLRRIVCELFLKEAKKDSNSIKKTMFHLPMSGFQTSETSGSFLDKYAHGNIICKRADILKDSFIVADILDFYFGKIIISYEKIPQKEIKNSTVVL